MAAAVVALRRQRGTTTPTTAVESACGGQAYDRNVAGGMVDARQPCSHRTLRPPSGHKRYDRSGQNGYDGNAAVKPAASFPRHLDVGYDRSAATLTEFSTWLPDGVIVTHTGSVSRNRPLIV